MGVLYQSDTKRIQTQDQKASFPLFLCVTQSRNSLGRLFVIVCRILLIEFETLAQVTSDLSFFLIIRHERRDSLIFLPIFLFQQKYYSLSLRPVSLVLPHHSLLHSRTVKFREQGTHLPLGIISSVLALIHQWHLRVIKYFNGLTLRQHLCKIHFRVFNCKWQI